MAMNDKVALESRKANGIGLGMQLMTWGSLLDFCKLCPK